MTRTAEIFIQSVNGDAEMELITNGRVLFEEDCIWIEYEEDPEVSGMEHTLTKIGISPDVITVNRIGDFVSTMVFEQDKDFNYTFSTPFGDTQATLHASKVESSCNEHEVKLRLEYSLDFGGAKIANLITVDCTLQ